MIIDNNLMYKTVKSPRYIRKCILNTAINFIELIQQQDKIKEIREEKRKVMLMLTEEIKNTNLLLNRFQELIPKAKLQKPKQVKQIHVKTKPQIKKQIEVKPSKLDYLQQELFNLKSKLDSI